MARLIEQVVGHQKIKKQLLELIGRQPKAFFSGVIFAGPEGVGKRLVAQACLQELNCAETIACGHCASCQRLQRTEAPEYLHVIEPQAGKIKVEQTRGAIDFLSLKSWVNHRFIIVDAIETINSQAANALLKSLEEPPPGVSFVLITSSLSQVLPTLRSRCQVVQFSSLTDQELLQLCPELEPWQARWSQGRLSLARKLLSEDWQGLRQLALNYLHAPNNSQLQQSLIAELADREKMDFISYCWLSYFRDGVLFSQGQTEDFYNQDIVSFVESFSKKTNILELFDAVLLLRKDIIGNVDKGLIMDQFSYQLSGGHV